MDKMLFSYVMKKRRKEIGYSLDNLAAISGISKTILNRIELGKIDYQKYDYFEIEKGLNFDIDKLSQINEEMIKLYYKLYRHLLYLEDYEMTINEYKKLNGQSQSENIFLIQDMIDLQILNHLGNENKKAYEVMNYIENNCKYLPKALLPYFMLLKAGFYANINEIDNVFKCLKQIDEMNCDDKIKAIIYDYMGKCYYEKNNLLMANNCFEKALYIYAKSFNFERVMYMKNMQAQVVGKLREYDTCILMYTKIIKECLEYKARESLLNVIYSNMSWFCIRNKKFKMAVKCCDLVKNMDHDLSAFEHKAFALFSLKKHDEAMVVVEMGLNKDNPNSDAFFFLKLLKMLIVKSDDVEIMLLKVLEMYKINKNMQMQELLIEMIIDYYEGKANWVMVIKYQKLLLKMVMC